MRLFLQPLFCVYACVFRRISVNLQPGGIKVFHMAIKVIFNTSGMKKKNLNIGSNDNFYFHNSME